MHAAQVDIGDVVVARHQDEQIQGRIVAREVVDDRRRQFTVLQLTPRHLAGTIAAT